MEVDKALEEVGQFGKYQYQVYFLLVWSVAFSAYSSLAYVFTASDLSYRCRIDECDKGIGRYDESWTTSAIPGIKTDKCLRYGPEDIAGNLTCSQFNHSVMIHCNSFIRENLQQTSIQSSFGLYCNENKFKLTMVGTLNNIGQFIGLPLIGFISDRYGRRIMLTWSLVLSATVSIIKAFSPTYSIFIILEVLDALVGSGTYSGSFILGAELTGPLKRVKATSVLSAGYALGEVIVGLWAWYLGDWRYLLIVVNAPGLLFIFYLWLLPESMRWMLTKGKTEETIQQLEKIAKTNGRTLSELTKKNIRERKFTEEVTKTKQEVVQENQMSPLAEVLKSKKMVFRVINCSFSWITHTLVFYGLSLNSVSVAGNPYVNFIMVSLAELPGYFFAASIMDLIGRRYSLSGSLLISAICCLLFHFLPSDMMWASKILYFGGKCAINCSFTVLYMFTAEMFPTNLRHSLLSICSMIGRIGSMLAPQFPLLAIYIDPILVLGSIALIAGFLALLFPETYKKSLPDSVEEADNIDAK